MWDPDNFPGADNVPWQLLIKARYAHEIDAIIASIVVRSVIAVADAETARTVATAAKEGVAAAAREKATAEQVVGALRAVADWDGELCPPYWPHRPFPWPPKRGFEDLADPVTDVIVSRAFDLVSQAGSVKLQESLGGALRSSIG